MPLRTLRETVVYQDQMDKGGVLPRYRNKETRFLLINAVASPKCKLN